MLGNAVDGGSVETKFKWGITVHGSHYGLIQDNVVYNYNGAAVATEDGSESFNVFDHNFVLRGIGEPNEPGAAEPQDQARMAMGTEGVGFWFRGPNNYVRNNVAANYQNPDDGSRVWVRLPVPLAGQHRGARTSRGPIRSWPPANPPPGTATTCRSCSSRTTKRTGPCRAACTYWWISSLDPQPSANDVLESVVEESDAWNIYNKAVYVYPGQKVTFDGLKIRGNFSRRQPLLR